jgi:hypothetical protein
MPGLNVLTLGLATAALTVPFCAGAATAKPIESGSFHEEFSETETDFCDVEGLTVVIDVVEDGAFRIGSKGKSRLPYFAVHLDIVQTYTNEANDRFATSKDSLIDKDLKVTDNGDGTSTLLVMGTGNSTIYDASGKAIGRNPGQRRTLILVDNGGTPADPSDDDFLEELDVVKESTGRSDDFCESILPALL